MKIGVVMFSFLKRIFSGAPPKSHSNTVSNGLVVMDAQKTRSVDAKPEVELSDLPQWYIVAGEEKVAHFTFAPKKTYGNLSENLRDKLFMKVKRVSLRVPSSFELFNLLGDPKATSAEITSVVSKDPPLVAAILRTVNSAHFALREEVTSVGRAIILLGNNNVKALALHSSFGGGKKLTEKS